MLVSPPRRRRSRLAGFRVPPALFAAVAVFMIGYAALAQAADGPAAPAAAGAAAQASPAADPAGMSAQKVWDLFRAGGPVMWVLAVSSVIALAIIFERLYSLRRARIIPAGFIPGLKAVFRDPQTDRERALAYCRQSDSPMSRMVTAFIKRMPMGFPAAEKALEDAGGNEALKLRQNMRVLYAIGSVATLLGLIGTIAGMIKAFMVTAKAGDAANKVELLSTGIYEAMVCTFGGLAVAILVTLFYYFFMGRIERLVADINDELTQFSDEYGLNAESDAELTVTAGLERIR